MVGQHTLAGGWNQSGDHSKFTRLVPLIDAVPTGRFGCEFSRGMPGSLEVAVYGRLEVGGEDGFGVVEGDAWRRRCGRRLEDGRGREHARCRRRHIHHRTLPILRDLPDFELQGSELVDLELQVVDYALDAWAPFVEHPGRGLECVEAGSGRSRSGVDLALDGVETFLLGCETLVDLVEEQLRLRVHGSAAALKASEMVVVGEGSRLQIGSALHKSRFLD